MLKNKTDVESREIDIPPHAISVVFSDSPRSIGLSLPSLSDLEELKAYDFVIKNNYELNVLDELYERTCIEEYEKLVSKYSKYENSSTYINRLANYESALSMHENAEKRYINLANNSAEDCYKVTLGAHYSTHSRVQQAYDVFLGCDLKASVEPNLRLAQISVGMNNFDDARSRIADALRVDMFDSRVRMFEGTLHLFDKNFMAAVRSFKIASESRDTSSVLFANMALAYWALDEKTQTIRSLKRSIALDPTNENSTLFLADVYRFLDMPLESVALLDSAVQYFQNSEAIWSRLGKSYFDLSEQRQGNKECLHKALDAFSKQRIHFDTYESWNNIGAVYGSLGEPAKAQRFFNRALVPRENDGGVSKRALSNLLTSMIELKQYREAVSLVETFVEQLLSVDALDHASSKILLQFVIALDATDKRKDAAEICDTILKKRFERREMRFNFLCRITYHFSVIDIDQYKLKTYLESVDDELNDISTVNKDIIRRYINNVVFAYLVIDEPNAAAKYLPKLTDSKCFDPYSMATLGLYHLKVGHLEKALALYKQSISIVQGKQAKDRFRQRMFYEIGIKKYKEEDYRGSEKALAKATKQTLGHDYVLKNINTLSKEVQSKLRAA